jgi:hypothetical protein
VSGADARHAGPSLIFQVDPLRKRPTTFSRSAAPVETDSTVWTETPAEKAQRIADEVAGIKRVKEPKRGVPSEDRDEEARKRRRDEQIDQEVQRHNVSRPVFVADRRNRLEANPCLTSISRREGSPMSRPRSGITIGTWASLVVFSTTRSDRQR